MKSISNFETISKIYMCGYRSPYYHFFSKTSTNGDVNEQSENALASTFPTAMATPYPAMS